jgi:hypothetical protein
MGYPRTRIPLGLAFFFFACAARLLSDLTQRDKGTQKFVRIGPPLADWLAT